MATTISLREILALSDSLRLQLTLLQDQLQLNDTLSLGDGFQLIEQNIQLNPISNAIEILDSIVQQQQNQFGNSPSDNLFLSDSLQILLAPILSLSEQLSLSDVLRISVGINIALSDTLSISDSANLKVIVNLLLSLSDTLTLSDSVNSASSTDLDNYFRRFLNDVG